MELTVKSVMMVTRTGRNVVIETIIVLIC